MDERRVELLSPWHIDLSQGTGGPESQYFAAGEGYGIQYAASCDDGYPGSPARTAISLQNGQAERLIGSDASTRPLGSLPIIAEMCVERH